jgi:hypothetical protein
MSRSPSIVADSIDRDIYIVPDDFGLQAQVWRETNDAEADRATLIHDLPDGQYEAPIRIVAFNTAQGWSRDVTEEIAASCTSTAPTVARCPPACRISWRSIAVQSRPLHRLPAPPRMGKTETGGRAPGQEARNPASENSA